MVLHNQYELDKNEQIKTSSSALYTAFYTFDRALLTSLTAVYRLNPTTGVTFTSVQMKLPVQNGPSPGNTPQSTLPGMYSENRS